MVVLRVRVVWPGPGRVLRAVSVVRVLVAMAAPVARVALVVSVPPVLRALPGALVVRVGRVVARVRVAPMAAVA